MIKSNFGWALLTIVVMLIGFVSCEQEDRFVGYNVVGSNAAHLNKFLMDVEAVTLGPDSIRADRNLLQNAVIGVYDEPILGKNKSYFYSQVRLGTTNPEFGENAIVDSVVLSIPVFANTNDTVATAHRLVSTRYTLSNTDAECTVTDTLKIFETQHFFEMDSLYGNSNASMNLQVHRVTENLNSIDSMRFSNQNVQTGELFGSKIIDKNVFKSLRYQFSSLDADTDSTAVSADTQPMLTINLDGMKNFVQNEVVNAEGSTNLGDQISFINNVLQGIRIGVADDNGFLFTFNPSAMIIVAYISSDNANFTDENGNGVNDDEEDCPVQLVQPRTSQTMSFITGSSLASSSGAKYYNVVQSRIYNEPGSVLYNQSNLATNYLEGMGGAKVKLSLDPVQVNAVKDSIRNNNWVISEAHFKIYPDMSAQNDWTIPQYLYLYNHSQNALLADYGDATTFGTSNPQAFPFLQISTAYDSDKGYYLLRCTEYFKNIVEKNESLDDLAIEMGNYLGFSSTDYFYTPRNAFFSNRAFNPYRLAIVGTHPSAANQDKKLQLEIYYNKQSN